MLNMKLYIYMLNIILYICVCLIYIYIHHIYFCETFAKSILIFGGTHVGIHDINISNLFFSKQHVLFAN